MTSLGLRDESSRWPVSRLIEYVASKRLLLVLDNCEHLLDACAVLADAVLREAPSLRILATSRQPLGVAGETVIQVGPLSVPDADGRWRRTGSPSRRPSPCSSSAHERPAQRSRSPPTTGPPWSSWRVAWTGSRWRSSLRAVRLRTLGLDQLVERLNDRFHLLVGGSRTAPPRHQTLEATIAWSHDLLGPDDQAVLRRLSVFAGSFSLEAAEKVGQAGAANPADVMDVLTTLVERSFVIREGTSWNGRATDCTRRCASSRCCGSSKRARGPSPGAHTSPSSRACAGSPSSIPRGQMPASKLALLDELDLEADNIRAALRHCLADPDRRGRRPDDGGRSRAVLEIPSRERGRPLDRCPPRPPWWRRRHPKPSAVRRRSTSRWSRGTMRRAWRRPRRPSAIARRLKADALLVRILANQAALAGACGRPVGGSRDLR